MTEPNEYFNHDIKLQPGTKARAEDVNSRFDGVVLGLAKLPAPHPSEKGFADAVAVGTPTTQSHAVSVGQALGGGLAYAVDTGIANAYVVDLDIAPLSYSDGLTVSFKALNACSGASTINLNGLGVKQLCRSNGDALVIGDIAADQIVTGIFSGGKFVGTAAFAGQFNELAATAQGLADTAIDAVAACVENKDIAVAQAGVATTKVNEATAQVGLATTQAELATTKASEAEQSNTATLAIFGDAQAVADAISGAGIARDESVAAKDAAVGVQAVVVAEGNTQVARVTGEGNTQELRVTNQGNTQNTRIISQGNIEVARIVAEGGTQVGLVTTEGDDQVARIIAQGGDYGDAKLDSANEWTKAQNFKATVLPFSASINWDLVLNQVTTLTLTDNVIMNSFTNLVDGTVYVIHLIQTTGGHTIIWDVSFKFIGQVVSILSIGAGAKDTIAFIAEGGVLRQVGEALNNG